MLLEDVVQNISSIDKELTIFQLSELAIDSETFLFEFGDGRTLRVIDDLNYLYLLEVSIAKEVIDDWLNTLTFEPTNKDIALRVLQYAINDA